MVAEGDMKRMSEDGQLYSNICVCYESKMFLLLFFIIIVRTVAHFICCDVA